MLWALPLIFFLENETKKYNTFKINEHKTVTWTGECLQKKKKSKNNTKPEIKTCSESF